MLKQSNIPHSSPVGTHRVMLCKGSDVRFVDIVGSDLGRGLVDSLYSLRAVTVDAV